MQKNMVEPGRQQMTICTMRIACWITIATNTHSEYVAPIAFPLQQWLQERVSMLHFTYIACLLYIYSLFLKIICSTLDISKLSVPSPYSREPHTPYITLCAFGPHCQIHEWWRHAITGSWSPRHESSVTPTTPIIPIHFRIFFLKFQVDTYES